MIQVGNEITNGMMWSVGRVDPSKEDNFDVLSRLISSGARACREVCPKARLIVHTEKAGVWSVTKNYYEQMRRYQVNRGLFDNRTGRALPAFYEFKW